MPQCEENQSEKTEQQLNVQDLNTTLSVTNNDPQSYLHVNDTKDWWKRIWAAK